MNVKQEYADTHDLIVVDYYVKADDDLNNLAIKVARGETVGEWSGDGEPTDLFRQATGRVLNVEELEKGAGFITVGFPLINMDLNFSPFANMWLFMTGGPVFEFSGHTHVRLLDFWLPRRLLDVFTGPKYGIKRTREFTGVPEGEPIIGTIVKPCCGLTSEEVARKCYDAAVGGVKFIKDDEKMNNPNYCPLEERVRLVSAALTRAEEETGNKVLYAAHITSDPDRIKDHAYKAVENGASGLMFNVFAASFSSLRIIAEDPGLDVPIFAHTGGRSAWSRVPHQGVDDVVVTKLVRILGGDYMQIGTIGGYLLPADDVLYKLARVMREPLGGMKDSVPTIAGGLSVRNIADNLEAFGADILCLAGTNILSHPLGIKAGVTAMKQAALAFKLDIPVVEYAKENKELDLAIRNC